MKSILLTWNPGVWEWTDFDKDRNNLLRKGSLPFTWSCGRSRRIEVGDRFFLMLLGKAPQGKGLVGTGLVTREPYEQPHWNEAQAKAGATSLYVDISLEGTNSSYSIADEQALSRR